jgi:hypothetical protein
MVARAITVQSDVNDGKLSVTDAPPPSSAVDIKTAFDSSVVPVTSLGAGGALTPKLKGAAAEVAATSSVGMTGGKQYVASVYGGPKFPRTGSEFKIPSSIDINSVYCQLYPKMVRAAAPFPFRRVNLSLLSFIQYRVKCCGILISSYNGACQYHWDVQVNLYIMSQLVMARLQVHDIVFG